MHSLPVFLKVKGRPVMLIGTGDAAEAKRRLLERAGARIVGEGEQAALALVACFDAVEAEAAATRLRARGILVNVVDRPDLCDFTMPAIVDRDPVLIAVGTGGASAGHHRRGARPVLQHAGARDRRGQARGARLSRRDHGGGGEVAPRRSDTWVPDSRCAASGMTVNRS